MSEQKNPQVSMYIQAISEQAARERGELLEASNPQVKNRKLYDNHKKLSGKGYDDLKMKGVDGYHHKDSDMADQGYIIKHASGNVSHTTTDEHDRNEKHFEAASRRDNPHLSDEEHKEVAKAIAKNQ